MVFECHDFCSNLFRFFVFSSADPRDIYIAINPIALYITISPAVTSNLYASVVYYLHVIYVSHGCYCIKYTFRFQPSLPMLLRQFVLGIGRIGYLFSPPQKCITECTKLLRHSRGRVLV